MSVLYGQTFSDISAAQGLSVGFTDSDKMGSGVSFYDFNQDGWDDLTYAVEGDTTHFYLNLEGELIKLDINFPVLGNTKQVLWFDYDNDGDLDLLTSSFNGLYKLFENSGGLEFEDRSEEAGLAQSASAHYGLAVGDYNRDGFLDFYVCNYALTGNDDNLLSNNQLYKNNGDGTFTNTTLLAGVGGGIAASFDAIWTDYDNDNWPDLYVINDRAPFSNRLYHNNRDGTFTDVANESNSAWEGQYPMTTTVGDYDNDGDLDIYMSNIGTTTNGLQFPTELLKNNGNGTFSEVASELNIESNRYSWGASWIDYDNNGYQDLYLCTSPLGNTAPVFADVFFRQNADGTFTQSPSTFLGMQVQRTYTIAKGDFNNDGYADLATHTILPFSSDIWLNSGGTKNHVKITLEGTVSNKMAIGSWIRVYSSELELSHYTACGENYLSQDSQHHIFGLNEATIIDSVTVTYPSGHTDKYYGLNSNTHYHFIEGETYNAIITAEKTALCPGDTIGLFATGSFSNLVWSTGDTIPNIQISEGGIYSVEMINEFGINSETEIEIFDVPNPDISANVVHVLCNGDSTGSIELINLAGTSASLIEWENGMTGAVIDSLPEGTYNYTYNDTNYCSAAGTINLLEPTNIEVFASSTPESGAGQDGTISLFIFGGEPPYVIAMNGDTVSTTIDNLAGGTYSIEITDANGCQYFLEIDVESTLFMEDYPEEKLIQIFPNPTTGKFKLKSANNLNKEIYLVDIQGNKRINIHPTVNGEFNISALPSGLYLLILEFNNGDSEVVRIQKL